MLCRRSEAIQIMQRTKASLPAYLITEKWPSLAVSSNSTSAATATQSHSSKTSNKGMKPTSKLRAIKTHQMKTYVNYCSVNLTYQSPNHRGLKGLAQAVARLRKNWNIQILCIPSHLIHLQENINALYISLPGLQQYWTYQLLRANSIIQYFPFLSVKT